ncbi:MAG: NUDIX hydrolase [Magnetococcales bacterium]|nr:NUDIX hydrolase [Magnetococcales bacterium]
MPIKKAIKLLEELEKDPTRGLNEDVFHMVSRLTPLVNVDLLIKDSTERILLTWRSDVYHGDGWHIPGGIVRYKETFSDRLNAVAANELQTTVSFAPEPIKVIQTINDIKTRAHFISFLFDCKLSGDLPEKIKYRGGKAQIGEWCWFKQAPDDLLEIHKKLYKDLFYTD